MPPYPVRWLEPAGRNPWEVEMARVDRSQQGIRRQKLARYALTACVFAVLAFFARAAAASQETVEPSITLIGGVELCVPAGQPVGIPGFGTFAVRHRVARTGRNPATGQTIQIAATRIPAFQPGKGLKCRIAESPGPSNPVSQRRDPRTVRNSASKVSATVFVDRANGKRQKLGKVTARENNTGFTQKAKRLKDFAPEEGDELEIEFNFGRTAPVNAGEIFQIIAFIRETDS